MLVSLIIPIYNAEDFIEEAVRSVLTQSYKKLEIICVNDGSTDQSYEILKNLSRTDNRIHVINQNKQGVSSARNTGLDLAKGDYLFFLDADDLISNNCILDLLNTAKHFDAIACARVCFFKKDIYDIQRKVNLSFFQKASLVSGQEYLKKILIKKTPAYVWGKLIPKSIIASTRFPVELSHGEDLLFNASLLSNEDVKLINVDSAVYYYRRHNTSATAKFNINIIYSNIKKFDLLRSTLNDYKYGAFISFLQISDLWTLTKKIITSINAPYSNVNLTLNELSLAYSSLIKIKPTHYLNIMFLSPILPIMYVVNLLMLSNIALTRKTLVHILCFFYKKHHKSGINY